MREFDVEIAVEAAPTLADGKTIKLTLQDSDDNVTFAPVPYIAPLIVTGAENAGPPPTTGAPVTKVQFGLATSIRRYLQLSAAVDAGAGDQTAVGASLALVF